MIADVMLYRFPLLLIAERHMQQPEASWITSIVFTKIVFYGANIWIELDKAMFIYVLLPPWLPGKAARSQGCLRGVFLESETGCSR
jgi:hypothetical protein